MTNVLLLGPARTPIGAFSGSFSATSATELGTVAAKAALARSGATPDQIDEVIFGNVLQAGQGQNPARQISIHTGISETVSSFTVNKVCGSGMKAIGLAWQALALGQADCILAGGTENMSQAPYLLPALRGGARLGNAQAIDSLVHDGLTDVFNQYHMGITAENIAEQYGISRAEQDAFAFASQQKAAEALSAGVFKDEIAPVTVMERRVERIVDTDEYPKADTTLDGLAKLRPAFKKDGTVTAGNASGINDGAAAVLVASEDRLPAGINTDGAVYLRDIQSCGCSPATMGLGPIGAVQKLLKKNGLSVADIGLWELNEAFAVQSLAVVKDLQIYAELVNVNGGAIALGHPIGCSGARIVVSLIHEMRRRKIRYGIAAMCIGGGQGIGCLVENPDY
ncbi:MAG: acetyl-CoA C-acetyltransferase [Candidatus Hydrogenedentes bacterium]|nr:acetyl-CoA C-acetyltransferase [Candidatus Hydrogenedentota bacterium]